MTMPCKQAAVDVADVVEPLPGLLDAANTLVRVDGGWRAENTDVSRGRDGAATAGVDQVDAPRSSEQGGRRGGRRGARLAGGGAHRGRRPRAGARRGHGALARRAPLPMSSTRIADAELHAPVVVSTVPASAHARLSACPGARTDRARRPVRTRGRPRSPSGSPPSGGTVVGGPEVLFWQATVQVELMTGQPAPIAAMRAALDAALPR